MLGSNPEFLPEANDKIRNVVIAETPTTGWMIQSGTNSPLSEVSTQWY
jgi:hypothetical protein